MNPRIARGAITLALAAMAGGALQGCAPMPPPPDRSTPGAPSGDLAAPPIELVSEIVREFPVGDEGGVVTSIAALPDGSRISIVTREQAAAIVDPETARGVMLSGADGLPFAFSRDPKVDIAGEEIVVTEVLGAGRRVSWFGFDGVHLRDRVLPGPANVRASASTLAGTSPFDEDLLLLNFESDARWRMVPADSFPDPDTGPGGAPSGPFPSLIAEAGESGRVYVAWNLGSTYRVWTVSIDGPPELRFERELVRMPLDADELDARRASMEAFMERRRAAGASELELEAIRETSLLFTEGDQLLPHIEGLREDACGRLWVLTGRGGDQASVFDLFDEMGRFLGARRLPGRVVDWDLGPAPGPLWVLTTIEPPGALPAPIRGTQLLRVRDAVTPCGT